MWSYLGLGDSTTFTRYTAPKLDSSGGDEPKGKGRIMDQTVTLLVIAVCLFGAALGLRFRVYVLVPAGAALLIPSAVPMLIGKQMAGWGISDALALLLVLNLGFVLGLIVRAGAAYWYAHKIAPLFAHTNRVDRSNGRLEGTGREGSGEGTAPTAPISRDLAKESFHL